MSQRSVLPLPDLKVRGGTYAEAFALLAAALQEAGSDSFHTKLGDISLREDFDETGDFIEIILAPRPPVLMCPSCKKVQVDGCRCRCQHCNGRHDSHDCYDM